MTTAENIAVHRRVAAVEESIAGCGVVLIRTRLVVCEAHPEPDYMTVEEVLAAALEGPKVRIVEEIPDLELLIDPLRQTRRLRRDLSPEGKIAFDEIAARSTTKVIEVPITCYAEQLPVITCEKPTNAAFGGNRSGKSWGLQQWLFRRWMMRGGGGRVFWWISPDLPKSVQYGVWALAGPDGLGGGVWPDEVFRGLRPIKLTTKHPTLHMIDGSVVVFHHANFKGKQAGSNLKSANVVDAVVDEAGAIADEKNYHQAQVRVSQTGGSVGVSTTRVPDHWSSKIAVRAKTNPRTIGMVELDLFGNPWLTDARRWKLLLNDRTLTEQQLETTILPAANKREAVLSVVTNPRSLREHFGKETHTTPLLWPHWSPDLIHATTERRHERIWVTRRGQAVALVNITAEVMRQHWPIHATRSFKSWAGVDFNVRGHAGILELFGEGATVEQAIANKASWTALVVDEVHVDGTTQMLASAVRERAGIVPVWYDPHGAKGHAARGTGSTTDAAVLRQAGFPAAPANGTDMITGKPRQLSQVGSRNVMHGLMDEGRLLVHARCVGLIDAFTSEQRKPDGTSAKRSSPDSPSDQKSGFSDSVRYGLWLIFKAMFATPKFATPKDANAEAC